MKKIIVFLCVCFLVPVFVSGQADVTNQNYTWYWDGMVWDDEDTLACLGEALVLTGPVHVVLHETLDASGTYHFKYHFQPQNLQVVGEVSGEDYGAHGVTQTQGSFKVGDADFPHYIEIYINTSPITQKGSGFLLNTFWRVHVTINANGETTVDLDLADVRCR